MTVKIINCPSTNRNIMFRTNYLYCHPHLYILCTSLVRPCARDRSHSLTLSYEVLVNERPQKLLAAQRPAVKFNVLCSYFNVILKATGGVTRDL